MLALQASKPTIPQSITSQHLTDKKDSTNVHWVTRNKWLVALAAILILMIIASIVTLVVLGLIVSPWLAIPCLLLFSTVLVGIGIFYNERKLNISRSSKMLRPSTEVVTEDNTSRKPTSNINNVQTRNSFTCSSVTISEDDKKHPHIWDPKNHQPVPRNPTQQPKQKPTNKSGSIFFSLTTEPPASSVDNLPKSPTKKLNLVLIGKPEVMPTARQMFCNFAAASGAEQGVINKDTNPCILSNFRFSERTSISLFEVKSLEDINQLMGTNSTLKFDAAITTFFAEKPRPILEKTFKTEPSHVPNSYIAIDIPVFPPSPDEEFKTVPLDYENKLVEQLNCNNGAFRILALGAKMSSENSHGIQTNDNQVISRILTEMVKTYEDSAILADALDSV